MEIRGAAGGDEGHERRRAQGLRREEDGGARRGAEGTARPQRRSRCLCTDRDEEARRGQGREVAGRRDGRIVEGPGGREGFRVLSVGLDLGRGRNRGLRPQAS